VAAKLAPKETAALARDLLARQIGRGFSGIVAMRLGRLVAIISALEWQGYAADAFARANLSLWPYLFQEAIYDSIDWHTSDPAKLHHLREYLELDFLVQTEGQRWADASDATHAAYHAGCTNALNWRTREKAWVDEQRALAGKLGAAFFVEKD